MSRNTRKGNNLIVGIVFLLSVGVVPSSTQNVAPPAAIQVRGGDLRANTPFVAQVKNNFAVPITFCMDLGKAIDTASGRQPEPNPFEVQKWNGKQWDTQLSGTDVGSSNSAASIDALESRDFSLQVSASGRYRLRLMYLEGGSESNCPLPAEQAKAIFSKPFMVQAAVQKK